MQSSLLHQQNVDGQQMMQVLITLLQQPLDGESLSDDPVTKAAEAA